MFPTISLDFAVNYYKLMFVLICWLQVKTANVKNFAGINFSGWFKALEDNMKW